MLAIQTLSPRAMLRLDETHDAEIIAHLTGYNTISTNTANNQSQTALF